MAASVPVVLVSTAACGQPAYPVRPLRLVVPFPPGASNDLIGRTIAEKMREGLGQPVIVDNRGGAGTTIGTLLVAKAAADGYTLLFSSVSYTTNAAVQPKLPFDPIADIAGISMVGRAPMLLVAHPALAAKSAAELIALVRARPGQINYASNGIGAIPHLLMELLMREAKLSMVHVPYKGLAAALTDLVAGQVHVLIASPPSVWPQVKAGKLRALAVSTEKRSALAPELPTLAESGVPGFTAQQWWGMFAPAATPAPIMAQLNAEIGRILATEEIRRRLSAEGAEPAPLPAADFNALLKNEIALWSRIVKERGIVAE
ncbi:MAG: tripartite tricarboxylate transporter substrate binding protein [Burkholderiales bacterium]|nr:tripartite tricarboxylate transporter substrate binding protein [Burkholderiales bacterium]